MAVVKFWVRDKDGVKRTIGEREMSEEEQKDLIEALDSKYKKARVDDLK